MFTTTECNQVEYKTFIYIARKLLYFHIFLKVYNSRDIALAI